MNKELRLTHDLLNGWYANVWSDGSLTIRNSDKGQRIELERQSVDLLREIFAAPKAAAA